MDRLPSPPNPHTIFIAVLHVTNPDCSASGTFSSGYNVFWLVMIVLIRNFLYSFLKVQYGGRCDFKEVCLMCNEAERISESSRRRVNGAL